MASLNDIFSDIATTSPGIEGQEISTQQKKVLQDQADFAKFAKDLKVDATTGDNDSKHISKISQLAQHVRECYELSETSRQEVELEWISALKQYKGQYDDDILSKINPNRSRAYVRVSRTKVKTVDSRLSELLFPANGDKNWGIMPSELPDINPQRKQAIIEMYAQETQQQISPEQLDLLIVKEAESQARKMEKVINDQLQELKYREVMREVLHSGNEFGTGILKGPLVSITENKQYYKHIETDGEEKWLLEDYDRIIPFIESVNIWDFYPDMEATKISDCRYIVQRHKMNKHDVASLAKRNDFNGKAIRKFLKDTPLGNYEKKDFELTLQRMGDVVSEKTGSSEKSKKYELLEFWGYVDAEELTSFGVDIPENLLGSVELPANVWLLGDTVIKAVVSPMQGIKWPYYMYYYDKDETSIFGEGIPAIMRDIQELINSAFRAMLDNAAISAGPQVEVNMDLLSEDEDPREIHPFKVWMRTGTGLDASSPALRVFQLPSYTTEFERMIGIFREFADEVTTIPRHMWGDTQPGAGRTASGLSMLMGSANVSIKDQVKSFDEGITKPFITSMYHWNMEYNENDDIKGDYGIVARGSASLIAKEMYTQYLINFANIVQNPVDLSITRRPEIIRSIADAFDLNSDKFVLSEKEIASKEQQQQQQQMQEREFMNSIVEAARAEGVSPTALVDTLRSLNQEEQMAQQQAQMAPQGPQRG